MAYRVSDNVARRTCGPAKAPKNPVDYEAYIYQRGLEFERPQFTFQTDKLQHEVGRFRRKLGALRINHTTQYFGQFSNGVDGKK